MSNVACASIAVRYNKPVNEIEEVLLQDMLASGALQKVLDVLEKSIITSKPLTIVFGETPNKALAKGPYYSKNKISIPYLYVYRLRQYLNKRKHIHHYARVDELVFAMLVYALLHEAGHALIDQYQLPIVGLEEDIADNFANYLLLSEVKGGQDILWRAALVFDLKSRTGKNIQERQLRGEHRLNKQRYYSMLCHMYGSNSSLTDIRKKAGFSTERARKCIKEFQQIAKGWEHLLLSVK